MEKNEDKFCVNCMFHRVYKNVMEYKDHICLKHDIKYDKVTGKMDWGYYGVM